MNIKRTLAAVLAVGILTGCSNPPNHGTVIDRGYKPGHYYDWTSTICGSYDRKGNCIVHIPVYHHQWVNPEWDLKLQADAGDTDHDKIGWIAVSQDSYVAHPPGSQYP